MHNSYSVENHRSKWMPESHMVKLKMQLQQATLVDSPSDLRADRMESISSTKMTAGCMQPATAKSARTIFSPCPIHLLVSEDALMLKKVAWTLLAMALPIRVLPVPGGPNRSSPLAGALAPCKVLHGHPDVAWGQVNQQDILPGLPASRKGHRQCCNYDILLQPDVIQRVLGLWEHTCVICNSNKH